MQKDSQQYREQSYSSQSSVGAIHWSNGYRKYSRITPQMKDKLIILIVRNNMSIKQAAQYLKINYSSAKFIFSQYRQKTFAPQKGNQSDNSSYFFKKITSCQKNDAIIKSTIGGKFQIQTQSCKSLFDIYKCL